MPNKRVSILYHLTNERKKFLGTITIGSQPVQPIPQYSAKKLHSGKCASLQGLGHNSKVSDFHSVHPPKRQEHPIPSSIFEFESTLNSTSKSYYVFITRIAHCHSIAFRTKSFTTKVLYTTPKISISIPFILPKRA